MTNHGRFMSDASTDVLMVSFNRAEYTARALHALLERSDDSMRVWLWHNGEDEALCVNIQSNSS